MVTVEIAVGIVSVVLLLVLVLAVGHAVSVRSAVCQAAREVAREVAAGGEDPGAVASRSFGADLDVSVMRSGRWIEVTGAAPGGNIGPWEGGTARCRVRTLLEQAVP